MKQLLTLTLILGALIISRPLQAGIGVTPPYIKNDRLLPGSKFSQEIILVRNDVQKNLTAEISIEAGEAENWIFSNRGRKFEIRKGESQIPILFTINVPADAKPGRYRGKIRIIGKDAADYPKSGSVGILLGAQIDLDLTVTNFKTAELILRRAELFPSEVGYRLGPFFIPGRWRLVMFIENIGNISASPSKARLDIYSLTDGNLLESIYNVGEIKKIGPFSHAWTSADFPTKLGAGDYEARYYLYKDRVIFANGVLRAQIFPRGELLGYAGYNFFSWYGRGNEEMLKLAIGLLAAVLIFSSFIGRRGPKIS